MSLKRWQARWLGIAWVLAAAGCSLMKTAPPAPPMPAVADDSQAQLSVAKLSERHGDSTQAAQLYQAILQENPQDQTAHHRLAVIAAQEQKLQLANQHFEQALASGKPTAELLNDYAYANYLQHDLDKAEQAARQALVVEPHNKAAHNNLALILGEKGQFDASLAEFRQVVSEAEAQANLAYVKAMAGDLRGAEQTYHHALEMDSTLRPAANALLELHDRRLGVVRDVPPELSAVGPRSTDSPQPTSASGQAASPQQQSFGPSAAPPGQASAANAPAANQGNFAPNGQQTTPSFAQQQPTGFAQQQPTGFAQQQPTGFDASQSQLVSRGPDPGRPLGAPPQNNAPWANPSW